MRNLLLAAIGLFLVETAFGQAIEITASAGYRLGGKFDVYYGNSYGNLDFEDGESFGVDINYNLRPGLSVNLQWYGDKTTMRFNGYNLGQPENLGEAFNNYFFLNGIYELPNPTVVPFFGMGLGVATLDPDDSRFDTAVRMGFNLFGGVKFNLTDRLGIKIRAAMLSPLQFGGGGVFCGVGTGGSGCSVGVGASSSIIQGDFSAGLVLRLGTTETSSPTTNPNSTSPAW